MLWLTRRTDEKLILVVKGVTIEMVFRKQSGNQVGVGIDAPDDVMIFRGDYLEGKAVKEKTK